MYAHRSKTSTVHSPQTVLSVLRKCIYIHTHANIVPYDHTTIHTYLPAYIHTYVHSYIRTFVRLYIHQPLPPPPTWWLGSAHHTHTTVTPANLLGSPFAKTPWVAAAAGLCLLQWEVTSWHLCTWPAVWVPGEEWAHNKSHYLYSTKHLCRGRYSPHAPVI